MTVLPDRPWWHAWKAVAKLVPSGPADSVCLPFCLPRHYRAFASRRYAAETRFVRQSVLNSDFLTALRREAWDSHLRPSAFVFAVLFSGLERHGLTLPRALIT